MRIGLVGDGHEILGLMKSFSSYDHEFHCISNHTIWPMSSKSDALQRVQMQKVAGYCATLDLDFFIVPPAYEESLGSLLRVLPLFQTCMERFVFEHSTVNKRGLIGDGSIELTAVKEYSGRIYSSYTPVFKQINNTHFSRQPIITSASVPQMKFHMLTYGRHDRMMRKSWKYELRMLKDAAIDTVIPANRSFLYRENIRRHHLNRKKIGIIGKKQVQSVFEKETFGNDSIYSVTIHTTDPEGFEHTFLAHKKWRWMLERGKNISICWKRISM